jgi:hypothetical protein
VTPQERAVELSSRYFTNPEKGRLFAGICPICGKPGHTYLECPHLTDRLIEWETRDAKSKGTKSQGGRG